MLRVALVGPAGAGKSALAYSFSKFLERRGLKVALANLDPGAKRLPYRADFDVRKAKGSRVPNLRADIVLVDTPYGLEDILYGEGRAELPKSCERVVLMADARRVLEWESLDVLEQARALAGEALGLPVLAALNKIDLARGARPKGVQALAAHERAHARGGALRVSGVTREGFEELWAALQAAGKE